MVELGKFVGRVKGAISNVVARGESPPSIQVVQATRRYTAIELPSHARESSFMNKQEPLPSSSPRERTGERLVFSISFLPEDLVDVNGTIISAEDYRRSQNEARIAEEQARIDKVLLGR